MMKIDRICQVKSRLFSTAQAIPMRHSASGQYESQVLAATTQFRRRGISPIVADREYLAAIINSVECFVLTALSSAVESDSSVRVVSFVQKDFPSSSEKVRVAHCRLPTERPTR